MLAKLPPLGWNSWNSFSEEISEDLILQTADAMVSKGLKAAGYEYVVIDDCWSLRERGADGRIVPDPAKFPHGMKYVADYIHNLGLKFGMYTCAGTRTCAGYPGSFDHEFVDAKTFAEWGVDFLKYDNCNVPHFAKSPNLYRRMGLALKSCGRDILFSACNWGCDESEYWMRAIGADMYRSTGDITDNFRSMSDIAKSQIKKLAFSGVGCYNDIDMLTVGMHNRTTNEYIQAGGMSDDEYLFHFAWWCMVQSPLMIGCDIRTLDETTLKILTNPELLRLNQDKENRPVFQINGFGADVGDDFIGLKHLENNEYLLGVFNFGGESRDNGTAWSSRTINIEFFDFGLPVGSGLGLHLKDIITGEDIGIQKDYMRVSVSGHGFKLYRGTIEAV